MDVGSMTGTSDCSSTCSVLNYEWCLVAPLNLLSDAEDSETLHLGFWEHREWKSEIRRYARLGTVPSYPNKSPRLTLDLPSVLKSSASACFRFGHLFGHIQSRKFGPA